VIISGLNSGPEENSTEGDNLWNLNEDSDLDGNKFWVYISINFSDLNRLVRTMSMSLENTQ
jgi:hypothetical protein